MPILHLVLLGTFLLVTTLLLATSSGGLNRAADVELYWRDVRAHSVPPAPVIFVSVMALLAAGALIVDLGIHPLLPAGYLVGGILWLMASVLRAAVVVTHHGIIIHGKHDRHRVAWRQIVDYFEFQSDRRQGFVLFYVDRSERRRRVEVAVPPAHREEFGHLLSRYVDTRLESLPEETYGDSTLDG